MSTQQLTQQIAAVKQLIRGAQCTLEQRVALVREKLALQQQLDDARMAEWLASRG